jgi:hypothetical protein
VRLAPHRLASRQVSALFGPRTSLTRQLAAAPFAAASASPITRNALAHFDGRMLARQAPIVRPRKPKRPRDFVRPAADYGARRCLSPKPGELAPRGFARCKASAIAATPASLPSLRCSPVRLAPALGNWPALLMVAPPPGGWSKTPSAGFTACRLGFPSPIIQRHAAPLIRWILGKNGTALPRQCRETK